MSETLGDRLGNHARFMDWNFRTIAQLMAITLVAKERLLDHLDDGPVPIAELATRIGMDADNLRRLLTYLVTECVLEMDGEGRVGHTPQSRVLQQAASSVVWSAMTLEAGLEFDKAFRSDRTGFEHRFGMEVFEYFANTPAVARVFADVMTATTATVENFIFGNHRFEPFELAVDVGGNHGSLLVRLLAAYPGTRGILFDLPATVEKARDPIAASAVSDRIEIVGGSFFEAVPAGADLYLLKHILHDWSDEECIVILKSVRAAVADGGRIAVVEVVMPEENVRHPAFYWDVAMMTMTPGRERRLSQFEALFDAAGFRLERLTSNPSGHSVVEGVAI